MIKEVDNKEWGIKVPTMGCDDVISNKIPAPFPSKNFIAILIGTKGSGKTSLMTSLLTAQKKPCCVYRGKFEEVILNMPKASMSSIKGKPFKSLPAGCCYEDFNYELLQDIQDKAEETMEDDGNTIAVIDDASSKLKTNKMLIDKLTHLVHTHRHINLSLLLLVQDMISVPLGVRKNVDIVIYFRPVNEKSNEVFRDEYLGGFSKDLVNALMKFVFRKKGDFLMVKCSVIPFEYYRNGNRLIFADNKDGGL